MRYLLKQKVFPFNKFAIKNEAGEDAFLVDGRVFSFGNKLALQNMKGEELAFIEQKHLTWQNTYEIYRGNVLAAVMKKHIVKLVGNAFTVVVASGEELKIEGDFTGCEYTFTRGGRIIAQTSQHWPKLTDVYGVDIAEKEDEVLILACAVVIDMVRKMSG